jgi:hypothetical protein
MFVIDDQKDIKIFDVRVEKVVHKVKLETEYLQWHPSGSLLGASNYHGIDLLDIRMYKHFSCVQADNLLLFHFSSSGM